MIFGTSIGTLDAPTFRFRSAFKIDFTLANPFPEIRFSGKLRPSQSEVVGIARQELKNGGRQLHIVAPPGSGKTVLGLYLWAEIIRRPCLVLSPNSAIQSQWAARTDLFQFPGDRQDFVSARTDTPNLLTSLTYQSVTIPSRTNENIDRQAVELWCDKLIEDQQALDVDEAKVWIEDLRTHNPDYFQQRFSSYKKQVRDEVSRSGDTLSTLHVSAVETLQRVGQQDVGLLILDECHHLLGHWGRVLGDALPLLNDPIVIGLTATPPDRTGKDPRDLQRYDRFFGSIDFDVPVPAVVKDGYLAPYQDLALFVRPTSEELKFVASADDRLHELVEELCLPEPLGHDDYVESNSPDVESVVVLHSFDQTTKPDPFPLAADPQPVDDNDDVLESENDSVPQRENLTDWLFTTLEKKRLPTGTAKNWYQFSRRDPTLALAGRQFLQSRGLSLPADTPPLGPLESQDATPPMEFLIPVLDRYVRHYLRRSANTADHELARQTTASLRLLGVQITETGSQACASPVSRILAYSNSKANALTTILKTEMTQLGESIRAVAIADFEKSSAVSSEIKHLMDSETGGAIAAFKSILSDATTDHLEAILVTGSTVLIDNEIESAFLEQSQSWLASRGLQVELRSTPILGFREITGSGSDWSPRVYVEMITELFQNGLTKCLVGTRGLLGEGWDANKINVLIDLTTVTTSMSINQLRGRSIRLDPDCPDKLANNWDVICIAPEFSKGFDDYRRFIEKHRNLFGVTDDGAIEKGVGHVHPALTEMKPEGLEGSTTVFNSEMLQRAGFRSQVRQAWKIGQPYRAIPIKAVETKMGSVDATFPPFARSTDPWNEQSLTKAIADAVLDSFVELGLIKNRQRPQANLLPGGYVRVFLETASDEEAQRFTTAMREILGPLDRPRYVIERIVEIRSETFLSELLPEILGRYFLKKSRRLAMLHAIPTELARNKKVVETFRRHWNYRVSPGEAWFALRGKGEAMVDRAKQTGLQPTAQLHEKEVFL